MSEALAAVGTAGTDPSVPAVSGARQFWRRLRAQRAALGAAAVVALLVLVALAAPLLTALEGQDPTTYHPALVDSARGGVPIGSFGGIGADHWLGVEPQTGRDMFARLVYGARVSLGVALAATMIQVAIGVAAGVAAALGNRWVDQLLSRATDVIVSMPLMIMALALLAIVPSSFPRPVLVTLVIGLIGWGTIAKIVRAQTLSLKGLDYVSAARLSGWGTWRVARRELLPGLAAPVITYAALLVPTNISVEAALSFLGVGVKPPTPSWGQMLTAADVWYQAAPQYLLLPAGALFVTVLALTVLGDGVRTALDPRAASRLRVGTGRKEAAAQKGAAQDTAAQGSAAQESAATGKEASA
ncbi:MULTISPECIES: ABC transporter permease [Streptomyces]|uniref:ABC transmembrane type-1 domain-containing protein n=1 Tax=Streptomyces bangladeshensis TaxID=295352 RepID=A0ABP5NXL1_9ACTN|nr:ABC transporter permease [Streptomyces sp. EAS-AB2608]MYU29873.1 ABC transporter permease subunit [Streptomyces sp. SID7810]BCM69316.1 putative peptide ABC transporter permease protein [Streptomyces sp. EAS-AB2608]CUW30932.1 Glutathione transport system permease protein GsiD [Streptomyces reticuli]